MSIEIWTEKYRPDSLDDVVGQGKIIDKLKGFLESDNIPHLLFAGRAGIGKTATAIAMAKDFYGESWQDNFLELNASDERGIDTIRTKVKEFARTKAIGDVPFKIILLDEADSLTKDAQHALRRTMESYASNCRFILDCNFSSKIISPIQSRCALFRFKPLNREEIEEYTRRIIENEGLGIEDPAFDALYSVSNGDLRKLTNVLQSCAAISDMIDSDLVYSVAGTARESEIKGIISEALEGDVTEARDEIFDIMMEYGMSGSETIKLISRVLKDMDIDDNLKLEIMDKLGEYEFRIVEGADEYLQVEALLAHFVKIKKEGA